MSAVPLHYVDLRTFSYATEDEGRVESALRTFLPTDFEIERAETEGHYGDPIVVLSARVERADGVRDVLDAVERLDENELATLRTQLDERVDEDTSLYVTFDKQAAYGDEVRLGDGITLRGKVEAYPAKKEAAVENVRDLFADLEDE